MRIKPNTLVLYGVGIAVFCIIAYVITLIILRNNNCKLDLNEFGDYIGGIFNPIFTLLSTIAIAVLTYFIAIRDGEKAKESLEIQKKVTLIQLRQNAFDKLNEVFNKGNLEFSNLGILNKELETPENIERYKGNNENFTEASVSFWEGIIVGLSSFIEQEHLFNELLKDSEFQEFVVEMQKTVKLLNNEARELNFYTESNSVYFLELQTKLNKKISEFIVKAF